MSGATIRLRPKMVELGWVVLPPGESSRERLTDWMSAELWAERGVDEERLEICEFLGPTEVAIGAPRSDDPNDLYVVFVYEKAIVAESPLVGNAAYVLPAMPTTEWMSDLSLPKSEVPGDRVIHYSRGLWKLQLKTVVDNGPPLNDLLYGNGVPFDFEHKRP